MKQALLILALVVAMVPQAHSQDFSLFDSALAQVGMTRKDLKFDQDELATWGGDPYRLSFFTMFHHDPFKLPKYAEITLAACSSSVTNPTQLIMASARRIDLPIRRGLVGDQFLAYSKPDSLRKGSFTLSRNLLQDAKYDQLTRKLDLFWAILEDKDFPYNLAMKDINDPGDRKKLFDFFVNDTLQLHPEFVEKLAARTDFGRMVAGVEDIAEVLRRMADSLDPSSFPDYRVEIRTRKGLIVIGTTKDDVYDYLVPPLLILDPGGNDTYKFAGSNPDYPLNAIIDYAGNDKYLSTDSTKVGLGGAILGMSMIIDKSGDDLYQGASVTQGCGIFGAGIVMDYTGNDTYSAKYYSQGAAAFGLGILADSAGNDSFYCYASSQ